MEKKEGRSGLGRFVRAGKAHGEALNRRDALVAGTSTTVIEDARQRLDDARSHAARGRLVDREWVLMTVRGLTGLLDGAGPRAASLLEEAAALKAEVLEVDVREFERLREDLRSGRYTSAQWREDMASRPELERDAFTHRLLGLHDPPRPSYAREEDMVHFVASSVADILDVAELVGPADVFYDVGCGTGKVAMLVRWLTGATVRGIEYDPVYVAAANDASYELGLDVDFVEGDARSFDYDDATVLYLYEPFRGDIMTAFLDRLRSNGDFTLLSRFVVVDGLEGVPWLTLVEERPSGVRRYAPKR